MNTRVVVLGAALYADLSVRIPHVRRLQKILRHRSWVPQEDGTYKPVEVPGPESYASWTSCWKVYETSLLLFRFKDDATGTYSMVANIMSLEAYFESFAALVA